MLLFHHKLKRCLQVGKYPHGKVAVGLAVTVPVQLVANRAGELKEILSFVAEGGTTDVVVTAEVLFDGINHCFWLRPHVLKYIRHEKTSQKHCLVTLGSR